MYKQNEETRKNIVGSANATNSGLSLISRGNMEMGTLVDIDDEDMDKIDALYSDAILVDDEIYNKLKSQYQSVDVKNDGKRFVWDDEIKSRFNPKIKTLFSHELPDKDSYGLGDYISFLDVECGEDESMLKESFRWCNSYLWLLNSLKENDGCMYFGAITEKLHNALVSDPKPYRRDVKQLLANMLSMIENLHMEEVVIDQPKHAQRVRLKELC